MQAFRREAVCQRPVWHDSGGAGLPEPSAIAGASRAPRLGRGGGSLLRPLPVATRPDQAELQGFLQSPGHTDLDPVSAWLCCSGPSTGPVGWGGVAPPSPAPLQLPPPALSASAGTHRHGLKLELAPNAASWAGLTLPRSLVFFLQFSLPLRHGGSDEHGGAAAEQAAGHVSISGSGVPPFHVNSGMANP
jgi:hypothetical protein